ncbi:MAG: pyridoxal-phosphate dependent enzyme [Pseudomonadota bacterium]
MKLVENPYRGGAKLAHDAPYPSTDAARAARLFERILPSGKTPLILADALAGSGTLWIKDERGRMGMGSFKALGAAYVIATHASEKAQVPDHSTLSGSTYVTASAGNHGLSVAFGAKTFGAEAVVYIADTVPESFADRLRTQGAQVRQEGVDYAASMAAAAAAAETQGWILLSDSSWTGYYDLPHRLMEGYLQMAAETVSQMSHVPSHIFLQAGVGGMACALATHFREAWGDGPQIIVVEPDAAPALQESILAGACVFADGPDSIMGRLDCKEPSLIALNGLARDADYFVTLSDTKVASVLPRLAQTGFSTTASGGAGVVASLDDAVGAQLGIDADSHVLCFLSETAE